MEVRSLLNGAWGGYAENAQHTAISLVASQPLESIHWQAPVDLNPQFSGNDLLIHYGSPSITLGGTLLLPVKTGSSDGFEIQGRDEQTGTLLSTISTDYVLPPHGWVPSYSPALTSTGSLAMPGIGGKIYLVDAPDATNATVSRTLTFFGQSNYDANPAAYNTSVFISTPVTADSSGNLYFGFKVTGANPLNLQSGIARIGVDGTGSFVSAATASGDNGINEVVQNNAPAVSNDGKSVYIAVGTGNFGRGYLLDLNSQTLATQGQVALMDPKSGNTAALADDGTASPLVGPDGDVYFGVLENPFPSNNARGWLLHFNSSLTQTKTFGAFGWDDTPSVVPASMVPSYTGTSTYLLMAKYNNYAGVGGDGVNRLAVLDPNDAVTDPVSGVSAMRPVLSIAGVTPDEEYVANHAFAVREWCINTAVVDPATHSVLANSEDGKLYRWDLYTNTFSQVVTLTAGVGEAYTPTIIGPDGAVFAVNNATIFAIGSNPTPVANADAFSTNEDTNLTVNAAQGVLANDTDGGGKLALSAQLVSGPTHGVLGLNTDGSFSYTPLSLFVGSDNFTYQTTDGQHTSLPVAVSINVAFVNHAPIAAADSYAVNEDGKLTVAATGVLGNDSDIDPNTTLTASVITNPTHGSLVLNANGSFTYTPTALYSGADSFTYRASDGTLSSATTTVSLTVNPVNHPPTATADSFTVAEDGSLSVSQALGVLKNDSDIDPNTTLTAQLQTAPAHGSLTLLSDGSFVYKPNALYSGPDSFTYGASDGKSVSTGTVSINVTAVNHAPTTVPDSYSFNQDTTLTIAAPGLLANDINPDANSSLSAVSDVGPTHGTLTLALNGSFIYTPFAGYRGPDSFTYHATVGPLAGNISTVSITVNPVNHPPVAVSETFVTKEDTSLSLFAAQGVLANDSDPDANTTLTATIVTIPKHGTLAFNQDGSFLYTPAANYNGDDSFTYSTSDGQTSSATTTATIHVLAVNDLPIATAANLSYSQAVPAAAIVATFTDADNEPLASYAATIDWGDGSQGTGAISQVGQTYSVAASHAYYTPGSYVETVTISDSAGGSVIATSKVNVAAPSFSLSGTIAGSGQYTQFGALIINTRFPTVTGRAPAGTLVSLYSKDTANTLFIFQGSLAITAVGSIGGGSTNGIIGQAIADAQNNFTITPTVPIGSGLSALVLVDSVSASIPNSNILLTNLGTIDVDTEAPRIVGSSFNLAKGTVTLTFQDSGAGLNLAVRPIAQQFIVTQTVKNKKTVIGVASIDTTGFNSITGTDTVVLTLKKTRLPKGSYSVSVAAGAIRDLAGNSLAASVANKAVLHPKGHAVAFRHHR